MCFTLSISGWYITSVSIWYSLCIRNAGLRTRTFLCEIIPILIHEVRLQIKYNQCLRSISWKPEDSDWVRHFRSLRWIETSILRVHNTSLTAQNRTNARMCFHCLPLTFVMHKTDSYPNWNVNTGSITSNYSCELTPVLIHEVRSQINHTQHLCSMSWKM